MNVYQTAIKPFKPSTSGPFGKSVILWAVINVLLPSITWFGAYFAYVANNAGIIPDSLVPATAHLLTFISTYPWWIAHFCLLVAVLRLVHYWVQPPSINLDSQE